MAEEFLKYKNRPLVRSGNTLYYGNLYDKYYLIIKLLGEKEVNGVTISSPVVVNLFKNDPSLKVNERVVAKAKKDDLYTALKIGISWLEQVEKS